MMAMLGQDVDKLREKVRAHIDNGAYGTRASLARSAGCTPETIDRFLDGAALRERTFDKLRNALPEPPQMVAESPTEYEKSEQDHWNVIADDFELLVKILRDVYTPGDRKLERLAFLTDAYAKDIADGREMLKKKAK